MKKSEKLEFLCVKLAGFPLDWDEIVRRFRAHPRFDPEQQFDFQNYRKYFSELQLDAALESVATSCPGLNMQFDPPVSSSKSGTYCYSYSQGRRLFVCYPNRYDLQIAEYDRVAIVDSLPVIFEVRLTRWYHSPATYTKKRGGRKFPHRKAIKYCLEPDRYNRILAPARSFFGRDVGYVMIIGDKEYRTSQNSECARAFRENNGILVPFGLTREEFREQAFKVIEENRLPLRLFLQDRIAV